MHIELYAALGAVGSVRSVITRGPTGFSAFESHDRLLNFALDTLMAIEGGRPVERAAVLGFCQRYQDRFGIPCEPILWEPEVRECGGAADALLRIGPPQREISVILEVTRCIRGSKGLTGGAHSARLMALHESLEERVQDIVTEERVGTQLYLCLPPDEPLALLANRLQMLLTYLPPILRKHAKSAWSTPRQPLKIDRGVLSPRIGDTFNAGFVTAGVPPGFELRYSTVLEEVYSPIPGCYVGIDHECIDVAVVEKRKKLEQYRSARRRYRVAPDCGGRFIACECPRIASEIMDEWRADSLSVARTALRCGISCCLGSLDFESGRSPQYLWSRPSLWLFLGGLWHPFRVRWLRKCN